MRKLIVVLFLLCCGAPLCLAQTSGDYPKNEFFAGYSFNSADINTLTIDPQRTRQNGVELAYSRKFSRNFALTADASAHFHRESRPTGAGTFERQRDQYYFLGGLQFSPDRKRGVTPFAHALAGASVFHGLTSNRTAASNIFTFDDATSFAMALGGGLDVRVSDRVALRIIQADYAPTFFGSGRQDNIRLSFGIVFNR